MESSMQSPRVFKVLAGLLFIICATQTVWILGYMPSSAVLSKVVQKYSVGENAMVYVVLSDAGGATVPVTYHYFLHVPVIDDRALLAELNSSGSAFLVTRDSDARVSTADGHIDIAVKGSIYSFTNVALLRQGDHYQPIGIGLDAQPDF